jgi:hypothetical protein
MQQGPTSEADNHTAAQKIPYLLRLKETKGYWRLKEEAPDSTLWITRFVTGYGPVARQTKE